LPQYNIGKISINRGMSVVGEMEVLDFVLFSMVLFDSKGMR